MLPLRALMVRFAVGLLWVECRRTPVLTCAAQRAPPSFNGIAKYVLPGACIITPSMFWAWRVIGTALRFCGIHRHFHLDFKETEADALE